MNTTDNEQLLSLAEASKLPWLPRRRRGKRPSIPTLWRWAKYGCYGVRLKTVSVGGTLCTTENDLREFFAAVGRLREGATR